MPLLVPPLGAPYAQPVAKAAARQGDGPWGEAIRYWLKEFQLSQTHIVEGTGLPGNTVSKATRGLDVHMATLRTIAEFFQVPFESVLVSPVRRLSPAEERHVAERLAEAASKVIDQNRPKGVTRRTDPRLGGIANRLGNLSAKRQRAAIRVIAEFERTEKKEQAKKRAGNSAPPKKP